MAENKNKIIVYKDWIDIFNPLTDEEAGKLIKHLFQYVNDQDPVAPDRITELLFAPIKSTLKRDLTKYRKIIERNRANGSKAGQKKETNTQINPVGEVGIKEHPLEADKDKDRDRDRDIDKDILLKKESKKRSLSERDGISLNPFSSDFKPVWDSWIAYRITELKKSFNRKETEQTAFNLLLEKSKGDETLAKKMIEQSIANGWQGLFNIKESDNANTINKGAERDSARGEYLNR